MDIDFVEIGDEIGLGEGPPPPAPVYPRNYLIIKWLQDIFNSIFSGKNRFFPEIQNTLGGGDWQYQEYIDQERSELAHSLIQSLDAPADESVEAAWDTEIARRIAEIDSGQATLLSREELRQKIQARLGTR